MLHSLPKSPPRFLTSVLVVTLQPWGGVISLLKSSITLYCRNGMGNYSAKSPTFYTSFCFGSDVCWEKLLRPYPPVCYMLEWVWKWGIDKFFCHGHREIGHIPQQRSRGRRVSKTTASTTATIIISASVAILVLARRDARVEAHRRSPRAMPQGSAKRASRSSIVAALEPTIERMSRQPDRPGRRPQNATKP